MSFHTPTNCSQNEIPLFQDGQTSLFQKNIMGIFLTIFSFISLFVSSLVGLRRTVVHRFKLEIEKFTSSHPYNSRRHHCHTLRDINERWRSKYLRRHDVLSHIFFSPLRLLFFLGSLVLLNGAEQINGFCVREEAQKKPSYNKRMPSHSTYGHTTTATMAI